MCHIISLVRPLDSYMSSNVIALAVAVRFQHLVPRKALLLTSFAFYFVIFAIISVMVGASRAKESASRLLHAYPRECAQVLAQRMDSSIVFFITIAGCICSGLAR